jgi:hypothetical protein
MDGRRDVWRVHHRSNLELVLVEALNRSMIIDKVKLLAEATTGDEWSLLWD